MVYRRASRFLLFEDDLEVDLSLSVFAGMNHPLGPQLALDMEELAAGQVFELDGHERAVVVVVALSVREIPHGHGLVRGEVLDFILQSLAIGRVLALAVQVELVAVSLDEAFDVLRDRVLRVVVLEILVGERLGFPAVDAVGLEQHARLDLVHAPFHLEAVRESVAVAQSGQVELASGLFVLVVVVARAYLGVGRVVVLVQEDPIAPGPVDVAGGLEIVGRFFVTRVVLEIEHRRVDGHVGLAGPHGHARVRADDPVAEDVFGRLGRQEAEEEGQHAVPEGGQTRVVDAVEQRDEEPRLGRPGEDFSGFFVVDQVLDRLPAVPLGRLDGRTAQKGLRVIDHRFPLFHAHLLRSPRKYRQWKVQ